MKAKRDPRAHWSNTTEGKAKSTKSLPDHNRKAGVAKSKRAAGNRRRRRIAARELKGWRVI